MVAIATAVKMKKLHKKIVRSVGVSSLAKIQCFLFAILGLFMGILDYAATITIGPSDPMRASLIGPQLGIATIVVYAAMYAIIGLVFGVGGALVYNLVAPRVGGIELELEEK